MDTTGGPYKTEFVDGVFRSYHNHSKEDAPKYGARLRDAVMTPVNWPTVTATEARQGFQDRSRGMKGSQESLSTVVVKSGLAARDNPSSVGSRQESWVTPRTSGSSTRPNKTSPRQGLCLIEQVREQTWATPQSRDFRSAEGNADRWENPERSRNLNDQMKTSGKLNPRWVETLMGLPVGWVMPSCVNPITPQAETSQSMGGGNWMTPEAQNSTGYQVSNGKKILRLGSQVMEASTPPVIIAQTSCDSLETELFLQPLNSPLELSGRN
jgi:hypothetical protein